MIEVLGLTQEGVRNYVEKNTPPEKAENIKKVLVQNPTLMSVCGITFYCMLICHLLSKDGALAHTPTNTYTRLLSFIILSYATRELDDNSSLKLRKYFPKLAKLAFNGLIGKEDGPFRLSFTEADLIESGVCDEIVEKAREAGILLGFEGNIFEFAHLSIQEMFAAGHCLVSDSFEKKVLVELMEKLTKELNFSMLLLYMFGLKYDNAYDRVQVLKMAMSEKDKENTKTSISIDKMLNSFIRNISKKAKEESDQSLMLQAMNLAYESQSVPSAGLVATELISEDATMELKDIPLTAVDVAAILFVCESADDLECLNLPQTSMDDVSVQQVCNFLKVNDSVTEVDFSGSQLGEGSLKELQEVLKEQCKFKSLCLNDCNLDNESIVFIAEGLKESHHLERLCLNGNHLSDSGMTALTRNLQNCDSLRFLQAKSNNLTNASLGALTDLSLSLRDLRIDVSGIDTNPKIINVFSYPSMIKENVQGDLHLKGKDDSSIQLYITF